MTQPLFGHTTGCDNAVAYAQKYHLDFLDLHFAGNEAKLIPALDALDQIGTLQAVVAHQPIPEGIIRLCITADKAWYTFSYAIDDDEWIDLTRGEVRYLCSESGAAMFTGTYFGMYATGNGVPCISPADFDWFDYEILDDTTT